MHATPRVVHLDIFDIIMKACLYIPNSCLGENYILLKNLITRIIGSSGRLE